MRKGEYGIYVGHAHRTVVIPYGQGRRLERLAVEAFPATLTRSRDRVRLYRLLSLCTESADVIQIVVPEEDRDHLVEFLNDLVEEGAVVEVHIGAPSAPPDLSDLMPRKKPWAHGDLYR